jgi:hypothetical protein
MDVGPDHSRGENSSLLWRDMATAATPAVNGAPEEAPRPTAPSEGRKRAAARRAAWQPG